MNAFVIVPLSILSLALPLVVLWKMRTSGNLLTAAPRADAPWRGVHVAVAFFLLVALPFIWALAIRWQFGLAATDDLPTDDPEIFGWQLSGTSFVLLVAGGLVVTFLRIDLRATLADLGWSASKAGYDVLIAVLAFLTFGPFIFMLQGVLELLHSQFVGEPDRHPFIERIQQQPTADILFWVAISAVVVAPLIEEFFFRVLLQGWFEKLAHRTLGPAIETHVTDEHENDESSKHASQGGNAQEAMGSTEVTNAYQSQRNDEQSRSWVPVALMPAPILISSLIFAAVHPHGYAPIPLFMLALVLGYLYQRTHRLLPCVVLHACVNGTTMLQLWYLVTTK